MIATIDENRLAQLKELLKILAETIDGRPGARDMAQLAKQYRETLKEIEEIQGDDHGESEIDKLLGSE